MKKPARKANSKTQAKSETKPAPQAAAKKPAADTENLTLLEIKELIGLIAEKQFTDFELERGKFRMRLGRESSVKALTQIVQHSAPAPPPAPEAPTIVPPPATAPEENLHIITSPIVGTFYRSSAPTAAPYVNLGDTITAGQTLCIVEAMKLMNEIQADTGGTVAKIFTENAQPVEYGQPLFGIKV